MSLRASLTGLLLAGLLGAPAAWLVASGAGPAELASRSLAALVAAVDSVGWVLVPQLLLAVAIFSLALQRLLGRAAGLPPQPSPAWLDPAVESALLLGLLGTISGMVQGFVGVSPDEIQPAPLVHALGAALRSSLVGFGIALVGVWTKVRTP